MIIDLYFDANVGNDAGERIPVDVKVGDKVLYSKYGGTEVHYQGEDYLIVAARDILAILG